MLQFLLKLNLLGSFESHNLAAKTKSCQCTKDTCKYEPYAVSAGHPKINQASWFLSYYIKETKV